MKKITYTIKLNYEYTPEHKGAPYLIDGIKHANAGELIESIMKHERGLNYRVNPATKYNEGSDIEEENASVKSSGASLACIYGEDFNEILSTYFADVHSTKWYYGVIVDDTLTEYHMDKKEFRNFLEMFGGLVKDSGKDRKKVRIKKTSTKMIKWFEDRL